MAAHCGSESARIRLNALVMVACAELATSSSSLDDMRKNYNLLLRGLEENRVAVEFAWSESSRHMPRGSETPI